MRKNQRKKNITNNKNIIRIKKKNQRNYFINKIIIKINNRNYLKKIYQYMIKKQDKKILKIEIKIFKKKCCK